MNVCVSGRDRDIDLAADEVIVDGLVPFKDRKDLVEMTIGDGMEFAIPGEYISTKIFQQRVETQTFQS